MNMDFFFLVNSRLLPINPGAFGIDGVVTGNNVADQGSKKVATMSRKYALPVTGGCNVANAAPTPDCRLQSPPDHANASRTATLFSQLTTIKLSVTVVFQPPLLASPDPPVLSHVFNSID